MPAGTRTLPKKIGCLGGREGKARAAEKAHAIIEILQGKEIYVTLKILLKVAEMAKSTYEYAVKRIDADPDRELKDRIKRVFDENHGRYGYRRITAEISKEGKVNHKKIQRLMKEMELYARQPRGKYNSFRGNVGKTAPNILDRRFEATKPFEKWVTDVSEFHFPWGKVYLSPILNLFNHEIVGYDISRNPNFRQTVNMLKMAFSGRKDFGGMILHSDQGWQYRMKRYQLMLKEHNIVQSMSRKGNCHDNAVMENFFGRLKTEMFYGHEYEFHDYDTFKAALEEYILWWNEKRIQAKLNWLAPHEVLTNWNANVVR
ncbi:IS3 family transposase [Treponema rectale]|uniref:IS3 family transposase n=1 Tax=Treponema rectale TaxID=744512 RepID=A0A7M1XHU7_9SPIR|nr:IS3 family transposase [Treponema rectale]